MKKFTRGHIESFLAKYATDARVLDIGAGGDDHRTHFPNRVTLDIDPSRHPDIVGDAQALPFPDESFDGVLCSEVFEHIPDPRKAVAEMYRVLKSDGVLILTTRFAFPVHDAPGDYWRFTPYALRMLFAQWDILEIEAETGPFGTIAVLLQRIIFQTALRGGKLTKGLLYIAALLFDKLDSLVVRQYGDITRKESVNFLLSSGIYIACRKKPGS
jgi:ubiquinone/menaquinone biosynthesis C-methylase UbiE